MKIVRVEEKKPKYIEEANVLLYSYDIFCDGELVRGISTIDKNSIQNDVDLLTNLSGSLGFLFDVTWYDE